MFDRVAQRYDTVNLLATLGAERRWRDHVTDAVSPRVGETILDLAAGTGSSSRPLADAGAFVVSADLSLGMLAAGSRRHRDLAFVASDALSLPFADDSFDAVTMSFGLRNVEDTLAALVELRRVCRPDGRIVICEFSTPTWTPFRAVYNGYLRGLIPLFARFSSNPVAYSYLSESILAWPDQSSLADLLVQAGWSDVEWQNVALGVVAIHRGRA